MKRIASTLVEKLGLLFVRPFVKFTLLPLHEGEQRAKSFGVNTVLLVETYKAMDQVAIKKWLAELGHSDVSILYLSELDRLKPETKASLAIQLETKRVVPVSLFWGRAPNKARSVLQTFTAQNWSVASGFKRFVSVTTQAKHIFCYVGSTLDDGQKNMLSASLSKGLAIHSADLPFTRQQEAFIGPDLSHQRKMMKKVLSQGRVADAIKNDEKAEKKARAYLKEIMSDYAYPTVRFMDILLTWLWETLYQGVEVRGLERLQKASESHELVYVPCHRSHIDYLLLSFVIYKQGLMTPHIAAGINLNLPIVGRLLRHCGAFFIRRQFRDKPLYKATLEGYVMQMCQEGFAIEYFIEGGRSRTGLLLQPKPGMLAVTLKASQQPLEKPIMFVPVYIGYEKLFESHSYIKELYGAKKKKETLGDLFSSLKKLKQQYGKVYLNIGKPFSVDSIYQADKAPGESYFKQSVTQAGNQILKEINASATVMPMNLLATALISSERYSLLEEELSSYLDLLHDLTFLPGYQESLSRYESSFEELLQTAERLKLLQVNSLDGSKILYLDQQGQVSATFLRNNNLHIFALPSLIASILVVSEKITDKRLRAICKRLYPYLKAELFLFWDEQSLDEVLDWVLAALLDKGLARHKGLYYKAAKNETDGYHHLVRLAKVAEGNFQRSYITAKLLSQTQVTMKTLVELCASVSKRFSLLHVCHEPDFLDKNLFKTFIDQLTKQQLIESNDQRELIVSKGLEGALDYADYILPPVARRSIDHVIKGVLVQDEVGVS